MNPDDPADPVIQAAQRLAAGLNRTGYDWSYDTSPEDCDEEAVVEVG